MLRTGIAALVMLAVVVGLVAVPDARAQTPPMTYEQFTQSEFPTRVLAQLTGTRDTLLASGVSANRITVGEVDAENLRYRLTATRASRNIIVYVELTPVGIINNQMAVIITVWAEGDGAEITHAYTAGAPVMYQDTAPLLAKLTETETAFAEIKVKLRAYLLGG